MFSGDLLLAFTHSRPIIAEGETGGPVAATLRSGVPG